MDPPDANPKGRLQEIAGTRMTKDGWTDEWKRIMDAFDEAKFAAWCAGRTGLPFGFQHWNVQPDLITVAKGMAAGYGTIGAVIVSDARAPAASTGSSGRRRPVAPLTRLSNRVRCESTSSHWSCSRRRPRR